MNEQDKKLLELYEKDIKKKKIFFCFVAIMFIIVISFYGFYTNYKQSFQNNAENVIQEETQNNIINENNTNDDTTLNILNSTNEIKEINNKEVEKTSKEKNITQDKREATKENNKTDTTNKEKEKEKKTSEKPANKDFLFTEGYTMDNVTQAAQDYLKSYNSAGECILIKDNDGVYLGMRVIFY